MHDNPSSGNGKTINKTLAGFEWTQMSSIGSINIDETKAHQNGAHQNRRRLALVEPSKPKLKKSGRKKLDGATDRNRTCIASFGGSYPIRWKTVAKQINERRSVKARILP